LKHVIPDVLAWNFESDRQRELPSTNHWYGADVSDNGCGMLARDSPALEYQGFLIGKETNVVGDCPEDDADALQTVSECFKYDMKSMAQSFGECWLANGHDLVLLHRRCHGGTEFDSFYDMMSQETTHIVVSDHVNPLF
jgi:hypothetical protein